MSLRLIYGRAGSGKSQYCFEDIKNRIQSEDKIYVITPEQFSFTAEKKLLESLQAKAVMQAEVLTFERMAHRVFQEVGGATKTTLSKSAKAMLVYNILQEHKKQLKFLGKSEENIEVAMNAITEFKKHNIDVETIQGVLGETQDLYLKTKLQDIYNIYASYQNQIENYYIDEEDVLTILLQKLEQSKEFNENTIIYIDEFVGYTQQEYELIRSLLKKCKQVNITVCSDSIKKGTNIDKDVFYTNKETANRLLKIAQEVRIEIEQAVELKECKRFQKQELLVLERNLYEVKPQKYLEKPEAIELFLAKNPFSEMEQVAKNIVKLVRENGYRYQDISVIAKNIDSYSSITKAVFRKYEIPVFIDEKKDLSQNILVKYVLSILEVFARNWSYEAVFNYIKSGFCEISMQERFFFENYCIQYGIKASKWYQGDFTIAENDELLEAANQIRRRVVKPLLDFKSKLEKRKNCQEISKALYEFLIENEIDQKLQEKIEQLEELGQIDLANEYKTSWDTFILVLDELVLVLKEEKVSFDQYAKILKVGLQNSGLGKIPATCDQVIMGDVERSRTHKVKAIFIVGLNDGQFPSVNKDEGFLNNQDRQSLKESQVELAKGTLEKLYEDNFNIYKAFSTAEEKLYLSYVSSDKEGKPLRPSMLKARLKNIFVSLEESSDLIESKVEITTKQATFETLLTKIRALEDGEEIEEVWFDAFSIYEKEPEWKAKLEQAIEGLKFNNEPANISKENIQRLYGNVLKTSISKLEQYRRCAFSFYLKYGLKLSSQSLFKIQSLDTGSFMHDVIDEFFSQVIQRELHLREMTQEQIEEIVQSIINEKLHLNKNYIFTSTPKYKLLTQRLKRVILKSMKYIIQSITQSEFEVMGNEVEFKKNAKYEPIEVTLEDGRKVELTGKIDRIDLAQSEDGKYVRIIDYKSSLKNIDLNEVMAGLQIQLLTYLDAVTNMENFLPAGVLYFNLIDPMIQSNRNMTDEEIELEIKKKFKMQGLILADVKVVRMMDKQLEKGASNLVPAYIDANEKLSNTRSSVVTKEQFADLQKYMNTIIKQIAQEIMNGKIDLNPYYHVKKKKTPCEYCEYRAICGFNSAKNEYHYIENVEKQVILERLKEEG